MKPTADALSRPKRGCLTDDEFYRVCAGTLDRPANAEAQLHLAECASCRGELAGLLQVLHPAPGEAVTDLHEPAAGDIGSTLDLIRTTAGPRRTAQPAAGRWVRRLAAAAALFAGIGLAAFAALHFYEQKKSADLSSQAANVLQQVYAPQSPSELRLDLPFVPTAAERSSPADGSLESAERLFNQALGASDGNREATMGLAYIALRKGRFDQARQSFQRIIDSRANDVQALLGRGASLFEAGAASGDPTARMGDMEGALRDFSRVLELSPASNEARFNRVRTLFELGRHGDALREIDLYLARDADSLWAGRLRDLKARIQLNRAQNVEREVLRAARARDAPALSKVLDLSPQSIPSTIRSLLIDSLAFAEQSRSSDSPGSADLDWAARQLEAGYRSRTGDDSYTRLVSFYQDLSPSRRRAKMQADARLDELVAAYGRQSFPDSAPVMREFQNLGDNWQLVRVHQLRGSTAFYKADFTRSNEEYGLMLSCAEAAGDPDLIARSLVSFSASLTASARYGDAAANLMRLKDMARSRRVEHWAGSAASLLGGLYLRLNQLDRSLQEYSTALASGYRQMDPNIVVPSLKDLGLVMERLNRDEEASRYYKKASEESAAYVAQGMLQSSSEIAAGQVNLLNERGYLALKMKRADEAESLFRQGLRDCPPGMKELEGRNRLGLAQACIEKKQYAEAAAEVRRVLGTARRENYRELEWQAHSLMGFLHREEGNAAGAISEFRAAVDVLGRIRSNLSSRVLRESFFVRRFNPFRELVSLLFASGGEPEQMRDYADQTKAITLGESIAAGRASGDSRLPAGVSTLEYFVTADRVLVFTSDSTGTRAASAAISAPELSSSARRLLEAVRADDRETFAGLSQNLHRLLVAPFLRKPASPGSLVIIPDGSLWLVPFGSLMDDSNRYLAEDYQLSYAPSRRVLRACLARSAARAPGPAQSLLLLDGSSNLKGAAEELGRLAKRYAGRCRLAGATELAALGTLARDFEFIHFSGHASLSQGWPRLVFPSPQGESYLDAAAVENWKLDKNRLVTLAGCGTGTGPLYEGESPSGLLPAFLKAGAPAVVVSLLPVGDADAGEFTRVFYESLASGSMTKAAAFRRAQLALLRAADGSPRPPSAWAPFILVGDPL
jgi:CHAT domain-containing protein